MNFSGENAVYRCAKCERRAEARTTSPVPTCGEYTAPTRTTFPDGSWVNIGEGFSPHGPMVDTGERIQLDPPFAPLSMRERKRLFEAELDAADAQRTAQVVIQPPVGPDDIDVVKHGLVPRGVHPFPDGTRSPS